MDSQIVPPHDNKQLLINLTSEMIGRRRAEAVDCAAVVAALLRQLQNSMDVGAFLFTCVTGA